MLAGLSLQFRMSLDSCKTRRQLSPTEIMDFVLIATTLQLTSNVRLCGTTAGKMYPPGPCSPTTLTSLPGSGCVINSLSGEQTSQLWRDVRISFINNVKCTNTHTYIIVKVHIPEINVKENDKDFLV